MMNQEAVATTTTEEASEQQLEELEALKNSSHGEEDQVLKNSSHGEDHQALKNNSYGEEIRARPHLSIITIFPPLFFLHLLQLTLCTTLLVCAQDHHHLHQACFSTTHCLINRPPPMHQHRSRSNLPIILPTGLLLVDMAETSSFVLTISLSTSTLLILSTNTISKSPPKSPPKMLPELWSARWWLYIALFLLVSSLCMMVAKPCTHLGLCHSNITTSL